MVQAMDHGASDRSESTPRSDGSESKRWIREKSKERWMVQAMDQGAIEGVIDGIQVIGQRAPQGALDGTTMDKG